MQLNYSFIFFTVLFAIYATANVLVIFIYCLEVGAAHNICFSYFIHSTRCNGHPHSTRWKCKQFYWIFLFRFTRGALHKIYKQRSHRWKSSQCEKPMPGARRFVILAAKSKRYIFLLCMGTESLIIESFHSFTGFNSITVFKLMDAIKVETFPLYCKDLSQEIRFCRAVQGNIWRRCWHHCWKRV